MRRTRLGRLIGRGGAGGRAGASRRACRPSAEGLEARALLSTVQDFEGGGTAYALGRFGEVPGPLIQTGTAAIEGRSLRLAAASAGAVVTETSNVIAFAQTDAGRYRAVDIAFDMRITPQTGRGEGLGFVLLNTDRHGTQGPVDAEDSLQEEPNFAGSFGLGFDVTQGSGDASANSISVHYDGQVVRDLAVPSGFVNLAGGGVIRVRATLSLSNAVSSLTLALEPEGGAPVTIVEGLTIPGLQPYASRVQLGARSGGASNIDVDNIVVNYGGFLAPAPFSFDASTYRVSEDGGFVDVRVVRRGDEPVPDTVQVATVNGSAAAGRDYTAFAGTLSFAAGETSRTIRIPILNDAAARTDRAFTVVLSGGGAGPLQQRATVTILDRQTAGIPPTVAPAARVVHRGLGRYHVGFELTFSRPMAATAADPARYQVLVAPPRPGGRPRVVTITGASYDAARQVVTLTVADRHLPYQRLRIVARGDGPLAVTDLGGVALDGDRDGRPGGDAILRVR